MQLQWELDGTMAHAFTEELRALPNRFPRKSLIRRQADDAVRMLTRAGVESAPNLVRMLRDEGASSKQRSIACWVAGLLEIKSARGALLTVFREDTDDTVLWESAKALANVPSPKLNSMLIHELRRNSDPRKRSASAAMLGWIGSKSAAKYLHEVLLDKSEDVGVREHAAEALGSIGSRRSVGPLITVLKDPNPVVRYWASFALGKIGDRRAIPHLRRLARNDMTVVPPWGQVRTAAAQSIRSITGRLTGILTKKK